jgi:ribonuclease PH
MHKRINDRAHNQLRPIKITYDIFEYAAGSLLYEIGKTKVLCAVTMQPGVPPFLRTKKTGWLTAEYSMLPAATQTRTVRDSSSGKRNGRSVEISRMIGRVLRSIVKLDGIGERTIFIDCDVQQADGGTRTACITGACLALKLASDRWCQEGIIERPLLTEEVAAISVGLLENNVLLDVDFDEDSLLDADFNIVITRSGKLVEIQGTAEKKSLSWEQFEQIRLRAVQGITEIFAHYPEESSPTHVKRGWPLIKTLTKEKSQEVEG